MGRSLLFSVFKRNFFMEIKSFFSGAAKNWNNIKFINVAVFLFFAIGFVLWRHGFPIVWDDTNIYKISLFDPKTQSSLTNLIKNLRFYFLDSFAVSTHQSGYRPLAFIWLYLMRGIISRCGRISRREIGHFRMIISV